MLLFFLNYLKHSVNSANSFEKTKINIQAGSCSAPKFSTLVLASLYQAHAQQGSQPTGRVSSHLTSVF